MSAWLTIIGVGEGGIADLPPKVRSLVGDAETVLGPERLLRGLGEAGQERSAVLPAATPTRLPPPSPQGGGGLVAAPGDSSDSLPLEGREGGSKGGGPAGNTAPRLIPWASPLSAMLEQILAWRGTPTVILATGDPLWFGIGATLARHLATDEFDIHPAPSAFQLAAARLLWPLQHIATISLHGRPVEAIQPYITPGNRVLALTSDRTTIEAVAKILLGRGYDRSRLTVLENLGRADERITATTAAAFDPTGIGDFHVLALDCVADAGTAPLSAIPGLPDDAFMSDGQLTKREVRAATLSKLAPYPGALLWDVGAGSGSVAIEWLRAARDTGAIAFERDEARRAMIAANAQALGVPHLAVIGGDAPLSLAGQPVPDAIFLGGDVGNDMLFDVCWHVLKPGGRLVANAVTLDGEQALYARHERFGGELARLDIAALDHVGGHRVMRPRLPVTQWLVVKP